MNVKNVLTRTLSMVVLVGLLGGCAGAEKSSSEIKDTTGGNVAITFFDKNAGSNTFDDAIAKEIMNKTGVTIEVENPTGDPLEKLNLMLTGQNYPDVVLMDRGNEIVNRYIEAGALVDLTDLIEEHGPNIKEMYGDVLNKIKASDGKNYYLSNWYGEDPDAVAGVLMRYDILKELVGQERADSSEPFTQEEYMDILKQFKDKYPTIDGKESIAVTLDGERGNYVGTIRGMFGLKEYSMTDNGLGHLTKDDRFEDVIGFMNDLSTQGYLDKEWVVNKSTQWVQKLSTGNVFSTFCSYWDTDAANASLNATIGEDAMFKSYKVVGNGLTADQTTYSGRSTLGWDAIAITKNCKDPEAAIKLIDFLVSEEGQYLMMWGIEGETWAMENGVHTPTQEILNSFRTDIDKTKLETGIRKWTWFIKNGAGSDGSPYDMATKYEKSETAKVANENFGKTDFWDTAEFANLTPVGSTPEGLAWQKIVDLYDQAFPRMVYAANNAESVSILKSLISEMYDAGLEDVEKIINENYNARMAIWK
ncbi:MAG TPA: extracellular solute-binding protein [Epulopiscium sp.]|nr:extracellular solute-binding protein [Candidatus Epulonipiscium sp.]